MTESDKDYDTLIMKSLAAATLGGCCGGAAQGLRVEHYYSCC